MSGSRFLNHGADWTWRGCTDFRLPHRFANRENVKAILDDQGLTFANVVKSTVFLTDLANFAGMNEVYAKYFTDNFPARSTIQVAGLPKAAAVEIEVVAHF